MITSERTISVNVRVFTKSGEQLRDIVAKLEEDCIRAIQNRKDQIEKTGSKDIQIHLTEKAKCANCGKLPWDCQCGRPHRSPAV